LERNNINMNLFTSLYRIKKPNEIYSIMDKIKYQIKVLQQVVFTTPFKSTECRTSMLYLATNRTGAAPGAQQGGRTGVM